MQTGKRIYHIGVVRSHRGVRIHIFNEMTKRMLERPYVGALDSAIKECFYRDHYGKSWSRPSKPPVYSLHIWVSEPRQKTPMWAAWLDVTWDDLSAYQETTHIASYLTSAHYDLRNALFSVSKDESMRVAVKDLTEKVEALRNRATVHVEALSLRSMVEYLEGYSDAIWTKPT